jgi:hypothetical protein
LGKDGDFCWPHKHAVAHGAVEIALAIDTAVVLARVIVKFNPGPVVLGKGCLAQVADGAGAAIAQLDLLSNG